MSDFEARIGDRRVRPADGWRLILSDPGRGIGRLVNADRAVPVLVEGSGTDWVVTLAGRRISVSVRSWRERVLAEAEASVSAQGGPVEVTASLPGLVARVAVEVGDEVEEGSTLITIEAMKMQNDVRAPRAGRVTAVSVTAGQTVATGSSLLRLE